MKAKVGIFSNLISWVLFVYYDKKPAKLMFCRFLL